MSGFFQIFLDLVVDKMVVDLYITDNAVIQGHFQAAPQKPEIKVPATGEETPDAYMTFILSGKKIVKNTGSQTINEGTFSFDMTASDSWEIGKLYTSEGAILFPYMINGNGY